MLFNSASFLLFFPIVTTIYFLLPYKYRWALLLLASCFFYMSFIPYYIFILLITIVIDYLAGIWIERTTGPKKRYLLLTSIISTCFVLVVFKYFNFFNANFENIASFFDLRYPIGFVNIILPIGLSFHTFQSLSYVIEVYKGRQKAEHNFGIYSLYVMFYPQLVAGPIERPQNLLHQFYEKHDPDYKRITSGLRRILWGLIKKIIIADNLATYVNPVFASPHEYAGLVLFLATCFFALQIYCDFSGYSDIALGSAEVMGFRLMNNFKNPYFATSISDFWHRWHISLSTWFKDYVYIPLGGNRVSYARWCFNMMVTFILSGFWHGANWTYVIWGALHGGYAIGSDMLARLIRHLTPKVHASTSSVLRTLKRLGVIFLVLIAWVFFRADTVNNANYIVVSSIQAVFSFFFSLTASVFNLTARPFLHSTLQMLTQPIHKDAHSWLYLVFFIMLSFFLMCAEYIDHKRGLIKTLELQQPYVRWIIYFSAVLLLMNIGVTKAVPFIYFQF